MLARYALPETWNVEPGTGMRRQARSVRVGTTGSTCTISGLARPPGLKGAERASRDSRAALGAGSPKAGVRACTEKSFVCCGLK